MTRLRPIVAFSAAVLRSLTRDRQSMFFMAVLPVIVIVVVGTTFGGEDKVRLGVVVPTESAMAEELLETLGTAQALEVDVVRDRDVLAGDLRRARFDAGLFVPPTFEADLAAGTAVVELLAVAGEDAITVHNAVQGAVDQLAIRLGAIGFATTTLAADGVASEAVDREIAAVADDLLTGSGPSPLVVTDVGSSAAPDRSDFSLVVPQNLVLFTFINATANASFLVRSKRDGVLRRALAAPAGLGTQLFGLGLGWFAVAMMQSLLIVGVGTLAFGMQWGNPLAAGALVTVWALVGCGAGLLVGAVAADDDRVGAIAPIVGIVLGALGGCMVPFEVFSPTMQDVALAVPHTWALTGWSNLVFADGGITAIAGSLAVLGGWAVTLITVATVVLRRQLATAGH